MSQPIEQNSDVLEIVRKAISAHLDDHSDVVVSTSLALEVLRDLSLAGYVMCRMAGHDGACPTCGLQPVQPN